MDSWFNIVYWVRHLYITENQHSVTVCFSYWVVLCCSLSIDFSSMYLMARMLFVDLFTILFSVWHCVRVVLNSCVQPSGKSSQEHYSDCWSTWATYISPLVHTLGTDGHILWPLWKYSLFLCCLLDEPRHTHQWPHMLARLYLLYVPMFTQ